MQYSSTSLRSLPLKRMPTSCSKMAATWYGLRGSTDRWSGKGGGSGGGEGGGDAAGCSLMASVMGAFSRICVRAVELLLFAAGQLLRPLLAFCRLVEGFG